MARRPQPLRSPRAARPGSEASSAPKVERTPADTLVAALPFVVVAAAAIAAFWPVLSNGLVNWDDPDVLVGNTHLGQGGVVAWAFSTTHMGHYQPLSWLAWAWLGGVPPVALRLHALSLAVHVLNAGLLLVVCQRLASSTEGLVTISRWPAMVAALLFAVHPLRVEPVAWASAFPYLLSHALLLASVWLWIGWHERGSRTMLWSATGLFALSQLSRVTAPLMPLVLAALAFALPRSTNRQRPRLALALAPLAGIALLLGVVEASARSVEDLATVGVGPRLASLITNPGLYLWRTVWPVGLTPLDPVPLAAAVNWGQASVAAAALALAVALTTRLTSWRAAAAIWGSYLLLLLPVLGLTPSGLQATADRYTYGPAMVLSAAIAVGLSRLASRARPIVWGAAAAAVLALALVTRAQVGYWHDSIALWSRAVALDATNDVALYNLALALTDAGRADEAIDRYQALLALVPDHELGRRELAKLLADREQRAGDALANSGRLAEAVAAYDRSLQQDPARLRTRANRGMALVSQGELARGAVDLQAAVAGGMDDAAMVGALAYALTSTGRVEAALPLLKRARVKHPDDVGLANNLARLLLTVDDPALRDPAAALVLAQRVDATTGGRDPRLLDTLALALAATGDRTRAAATLDRAIDFAREAGDAGLAAELANRRARLLR